MKVLVTFDIEVWCEGWDRLDERFPASFERYVYGRSSRGEYALPRTLEIMAAHGVRGIFFVEPLFAARFGVEHLRTIVSLIRDAGHDVQLHLHPEWTDELSPAPWPGIAMKRPRLSDYTGDEQARLLRMGIELLELAGAGRAVAFRCGNFAAGRSTFGALAANGIGIDFSINATVPASVPDLRDGRDLVSPQRIDGVCCLPVTVFRDGFGTLRHAQVGACSCNEIVQAMERAALDGWEHFVLFSHNFEMLKSGSSEPDRIVARRFEDLCRYLGEHRDRLPTATTEALTVDVQRPPAPLPAVSAGATLRRYVEQALRRAI